MAHGAASQLGDGDTDHQQPAWGRREGTTMDSARVHTPHKNQTIVTIGGNAFYFSYQTCVAARVGGDLFRRDHNYSPTTAKHMGQMRCADWPKVDDAEFERRIAASQGSNQP